MILDGKILVKNSFYAWCFYRISPVYRLKLSYVKNDMDIGIKCILSKFASTRGLACHPEGPGQAWEVGPWEPDHIQQGQEQRSESLSSGHPLVPRQAGGWKWGELGGADG